MLSIEQFHNYGCLAQKNNFLTGNAKKMSLKDWEVEAALVWWHTVHSVINLNKDA